MKSNHAFTLVECMIVVVIIGLLAATAIAAFQKVLTNSQDKAVPNNAGQLAAGADQYFSGKASPPWRTRPSSDRRPP